MCLTASYHALGENAAVELAAICREVLLQPGDPRNGLRNALRRVRPCAKPALLSKRRPSPGPLFSPGMFPTAQRCQ